MYACGYQSLSTQAFANQDAAGLYGALMQPANFIAVGLDQNEQLVAVPTNEHGTGSSMNPWGFSFATAGTFQETRLEVNTTDAQGFPCNEVRLLDVLLCKRIGEELLPFLL